MNVFTKKCEYHIEECDIPVVEDTLGGEGAIEGEVVLLNCENDVFVEEVKNTFCYSYITHSSVEKNQFP